MTHRTSHVKRHIALLTTALLALSACATTPAGTSLPPAGSNAARAPVTAPVPSTRQAIDLSGGAATPSSRSTVLPDEPPVQIIPRGRNEASIGAEQHPLVLEQFGGAVTDPTLTAYVESIGRRIVANTEQPNADWTFTILDTPVINAFAVPGGYIYVTRGLIALADDEAELAAVIGHEIGHVTAKHGAERAVLQREANLGVVGATLLGAVLGGPAGALAGRELSSVVGAGNVAGYSREQEYEADALGVRYIAETGYAPEAQADFLTSMNSHYALLAEIEGRAYDGSQVNFLSTHPPSEDREQRARLRAANTGIAGGGRGEDQFLDAIDGMVYGESVSLGAIYNGNRFVEPTLGYSVQFPADWEGSLRPAGLDLNGPRGSRSVLTRVEEEAGTNPVRYLSSGYLTNFFNRFGTGVRPRVERFDIGGRDTARARFRGVFNGQDAEVNITVVSYGNGLLRFITITPPGDTRLRRAAESIPRGLTRASARDVQDARRLESIEIYTVRPGDTLQAIAARMVEGPRPEDRLRVLNSLSPRYRPQPGDRLKLIVR